MVAKMRTGQLDGAFLSSAGLSTIYRDVMVLQLPGMIQDWRTLDRVRSALDSTLRNGFAAAGFSLLGWSDVGHVREFSRGFVARRPDDIKGHRPLVWRNDPITPTLYATIGGVVPSPLSPGEVLPALRTGKVDYLLAPAVAAEQLQWTPYLDYVTSDVTACAIGGTVLKTSQLDALPPDLRTTFSELSVKMARAQMARVRKDDAASFERVSRISKVVTLSPSDRAAWNVVWQKAVKRLTQGTFPKPLVEEVAKIAGRKGA
jgi:TRAP-type C4-dicarboxylate transport system substrate-binding protein